MFLKFFHIISKYKWHCKISNIGMYVLIIFEWYKRCSNSFASYYPEKVVDIVVLSLFYNRFSFKIPEIDFSSEPQAPTWWQREAKKLLLLSLAGTVCLLNFPVLEKLREYEYLASKRYLPFRNLFDISTNLMYQIDCE